MADVYITEYVKLGADANGNVVLAGFEPNVAEQIIVGTGSSQQSAALNAQTTFVMVHVKGATGANILFGTNPTAVITKGHLSGGETRFYAVQPGQSIKIAAINEA